MKSEGKSRDLFRTADKENLLLEVIQQTSVTKCIQSLKLSMTQKQLSIYIVHLKRTTKQC